MNSQEPAPKRAREAAENSSSAGDDDELVLPQTAAGGDDLAGRLRDAEAAIRTLVATLRAERHERKALARSVDELEDAVHRHKKRVKRAEAELEELRGHITQLARGPFSAAAAAAAAAADASDGLSPLSPAGAAATSAPGTGRRRRDSTARSTAGAGATGSSSGAGAGAAGAGAATGRREYVALTTAPDPDRPVTDEDKQRIRSNINRLPPERMPPLVSFLQGQLPTIALVLPDDMRIVPNTVEVDFDTLDNRTLRAVDHKVRQALALAGQARRRAERRLLEMQIEQEQQQRHSAVGGLEPLVAAATVATVHSPLPSSSSSSL